MKLVALALFITLTSLAQAAPRPCEVYGISDSPQRLDCQIQGEEMRLRCKSGEYFLNTQKVDVAYHEEVEEGPVPLIFRTSEVKLKVLIHSTRKIDAEVSRRSGEASGTCRP